MLPENRAAEATLHCVSQPACSQARDWVPQLAPFFVTDAASIGVMPCLGCGANAQPDKSQSLSVSTHNTGVLVVGDCRLKDIDLSSSASFGTSDEVG